MTDLEDAPTTDRETVARLFELGDYMIAFGISVAVDLDVADHLADGPLDVRELAERTRSNTTALQRVLRKIYAGSTEMLLTQLVSDRKLSAPELKRMRQLLDDRLSQEEA